MTDIARGRVAADYSLVGGSRGFAGSGRAYRTSDGEVVVAHLGAEEVDGLVDAGSWLELGLLVFAGLGALGSVVFGGNLCRNLVAWCLGVAQAGLDDNAPVVLVVDLASDHVDVTISKDGFPVEFDTASVDNLPGPVDDLVGVLQVAVEVSILKNRNVSIYGRVWGI